MPQSHPTTDPVRFLTPVRFLVCKAGFILRARVYARMRAYTRAYAEPFILPAYSSARVYARMRAYVRRRVQPSWTFKAGVDISSNQMRLRGSRSTNGYRRHGNLHAYTRVCSYLKFTTHLRGAIMALGVAQRGAYARWWSQKVWIQL